MTIDLPLPLGTRVELDADTVLHDNGSLVGGSPGRIFKLNARARRAFEDLLSGEVSTSDAAVLGRRLADAGALHPQAGRPDPTRCAASVTVVIPVRDRLAELDRCLTAGFARGSAPLAQAEAPADPVKRVVVVDDGSLDAPGVAAVVGNFGVRLVRREVNGGPGAARNTGLEHVDTPFVAFLDSDCLPPATWIAELIGHFDDPAVAAVAPRITSAPARNVAQGIAAEAAHIAAAEGHSPAGHSPAGHPRAGHPPGTGSGWFSASAARFAAARPVLDLGDRPARVQPMTRVSYLPTAALIVRTAALKDISPPNFDPGLRWGEDVDLIWRLIDAGWRIRYDPSVRVPHAEPDGWPALLRRRFAYGTSAALLADRHPGRVSPLVLVAAPAVAVVGALTRRPLLAAAGLAAGYADAALTLRRAGLPVKGIAKPLAQGTLETFFGTSRWISQFACPAVAVAAGLHARSRRERAIRAVVLTGWLTASAVREWRRARPPVSLPEWTLGVLADDIAYGAGVWRGSLRRRHLRAVLPQYRWHLVARPVNSP